VGVGLVSVQLYDALRHLYVHLAGLTQQRLHNRAVPFSSASRHLVETLNASQNLLLAGLQEGSHLLDRDLSVMLEDGIKSNSLESAETTEHELQDCLRLCYQ
jgi:hypothetical protein